MDQKLDDLLDKFDAREQENAIRKSTEASEKEKFIQDFLKIRDNLIEEVFEKFKAQFERRGHNVEVIKKESSWDVHKKTSSEPGIAIYLKFKKTSTDGYQRNLTFNEHNTPSFGFRCNSSKKTMWAHESTIGPGHGGSSGSKGEFKLEEVNKELIEKQLVSWVEALMRSNGTL